MPHRFVFAAILALGALGARAESPSLDQADPKAGHELARAICAECHRVEPEQAPVKASPAPDFADLGARPGVDAAHLVGYLSGSHPSMPNIDLTLEYGDREDLAAYILGLGGAAGAR